MKKIFPLLACFVLSLGFAQAGILEKTSVSSGSNVHAPSLKAEGASPRQVIRVLPKPAREGERKSILAVKPRDAVRLVSYNIRGIRGMDDQKDYERTARVIKDIEADVVALQEVDKGTSRNQKVDQAKKMGELTGMEHVFAGAIPYQGGEYGIAVLSKEKPVGTEKIVLPGSKEARALLVVEFENFVFCCTHFDLVKKDRVASARIANELVDKYKKPVFLAGDLNAHPNSETIKELKKEWTLLTPDNEKTYPADQPSETIDYIFAGKEKRISYKLLNSGVVNEPAASDHRPIYADVLIRK